MSDNQPPTREELNVEMAALRQQLSELRHENQRLRESEERYPQNVFFTLLQEAIIQVLSSGDVNSVLENIAQQAGQLLDTPHVVIGLVDDEDHHMQLKVGLGLLAQSLGTNLHPGEGVVGQVWQTGQPLVVDDYDRWPHHTTTFRPQTIRAAIGVPLILKQHVIGVLSLAYPFTTDRDFTPADMDKLVIFARLAAVAIHNARLLATEREARQQAETLQAAARALGATLDRRQVLPVILSELRKVVPYDSSSVFALEDDWLVWTAGYGFPDPNELMGLKFHVTDKHTPNFEVLSTRAPVIYDDVSQHYAGFTMKPHDQYLIHSWLGVPMFFGDQVVGMLTMDQRQIGFYRQQHAELALAFATQAATAVQNAHLFEQVRQHADDLERQVIERTRALTEAYEQLKELDRVKDDFVTRISHELRTPLANIRLYISLLEHGKPEKQAEYLETLNREAARLNKLIEDLLDISQLDMGKTPVVLVPVDLNRLIGDLLPDRQAQAIERGLTLHFEPRPNLPRIWADPALLIQVLSNLLSNALNYTPPGGSITCASRTARRVERNWVTLTVADTGPGLSPHDQQRMFERFYRGQAARDYKVPGTGLGLAISHEIMNKLGGLLTVESEPGQGAAFTVWLKPAD